jgi:O-antigen biosynthesis protein WbqV
LARNLILLSGLQPDRDIEIEFTGMRAGEKLVEELHLREEQLVPTSHVNIYRLLSSDDIDASRVTALLPELQLATKSLDPVRVIQLLREMVPDYIPSSQLLENAKSMQTTGRSSNDQVSMPQSVEPMLVTSK